MQTYLALLSLNVNPACKAWLYDTQVCYVRVAFKDLRDEVRERRYGVLHPHVYSDQDRQLQFWSPNSLAQLLTLECAPGTDSECSLLRTHRCDHGVDDLERKAAPVLDGASILVRALVRHILRELVDEVPMGGMDLDPIAARPMYCVACCLRECLDVLLNLWASESPGKSQQITGNSPVCSPGMVSARGTSSGRSLSGIAEAET